MSAVERVCWLHADVHPTTDPVGVVTPRGDVISADRGCARKDAEPDLIVDVSKCTGPLLVAS